MKLKFDYLTKCLLLFLVAMGMSSLAMSQRTITGVVTDGESGDPLIGANILVVGTSTGTVTDIDGSYSVQVPSGATELEFTYTGYSAKKVTIGASNVMDVSLSSGELLNEVVVVGYGTQKSKEVTSSVVSVKAEDFNKGNVNTPTQLLQGKVAGLTIARGGGNPNSDFQVRLRGISTIGANTQPLVIVDGVIGASLDGVDPNDIASIDVLKDGSAGAIYGTRASSGVIIVTTKKGTSGKSSVDYSGYVSFESVANTAAIASAEDFLSLGGVRITADNTGASVNENNDWYDELTRTAISHVHNFSFSGGAEKFTYRASVNYRDVQGIANNTGFDQVNGRLNLTQRALNDRLTVNFNLAATTRNIDFGFDEALRYAAIFNPTAPIRNADGTFYEQNLFDYYNPVAIQQQNTHTGNRKEVFGNVSVDYELIDGLKAGIRYAQTRVNRIEDEYYSKTARFRGEARNGLARKAYREEFNELFEATINYTKDFDDLGFNFVGGYSYQDFDDVGLYAEVGNFIRDDFGFNNLFAGEDIANGLATVASGRQTQRLVAFFGRASFNYNDTYFLQASVRREGSSVFGKDEKWGIFPAISAGVQLTELVDIGGVDNLKLRVGYGVTGNRPRDPYLSLETFDEQGFAFLNGRFSKTYGPGSNPNPNLKWETKSEVNIGLDFALLDYKVTGSVEYYTRSTEDGILLVNVPVPPNLFPQTWTNVGQVENNGFEMALQVNDAYSNNKFSWTPALTFSTFKSKLVKFTNDRSEDFRANVGAPGQNGTNMIRLVEGQEIGQIWGPVFEGLNDDGSWRFRDVNGDGVIEPGFGEPDNAVIGNGLPDFEFGLNNTFTFGKFDFNFFLRGAVGHDLVNTNSVFYEVPNFFGSQNGVKSDKFLDGLTSDADFNSYHVENASFVKLDNATLGYTVPLNSSSFKNLRVYVSGQNLFVITDYTGVDPEVRFQDPGESDNGGDPTTVNRLAIFTVNNDDPLAPGIERRNQWALTRTITFGLNLGF